MLRAVFCLGAVSVGMVAAASPLADIIEKVEPSCVRIDVRTPMGAAIGSGFIMQEGDWVVTNHHVIAGATRGQVEFSDKTLAPIEGFLAYDERRDIAVLKIKLDKQRTPLTLSSGEARKGDAAIAIGAPQGLSFTTTEGIISAFRTGDDLKEFGMNAVGDWLQVSVPISPGSSGGPVLNSKGEVVGASTACFTSGQNLNLAISAADIAIVLERAASAKVQPLTAIEPRPETIATGPGGRPRRPGVGSLPEGGAGIPRDNVSIKLPAKRRFSHRYLLSEDTDAFDKVTWVRSTWIPLKHNDGRLTSAAFRVGVSFNEVGPTPYVLWETMVTSGGFSFGDREKRRFQVLGVDDKKIEVWDTEHKMELNRRGHGWQESITAKVRVDQFLDIALAKKETKGRLGPMDFVLSNAELECFRELLSKVPSGTASDGESTVKIDHYPLEDDPTAPVALANAVKSSKNAKEKRASGAFREWESADGNFTIDAKLIRVTDDSVELQRRDGREVTMPLESLSEADREFAAKQKK